MNCGLLSEWNCTYIQTHNIRRYNIIHAYNILYVHCTYIRTYIHSLAAKHTISIFIGIHSYKVPEPTYTENGGHKGYLLEAIHALCTAVWMRSLSSEYPTQDILIHNRQLNREHCIIHNMYYGQYPTLE